MTAGKPPVSARSSAGGVHHHHTHTHGWNLSPRYRTQQQQLEQQLQVADDYNSFYAAAEQYFMHVMVVRGGAEGADEVEVQATTSSTVPHPPTTQDETKDEKKDDNDNSDSDDNHSNKYVFSIYQVGDGSDTDPDRIPTRFVRMHKGNRAAAKAAFDHTDHWRQENNVDTILQRPHPRFDICKSITPHYFLGRDTHGHVVFFQRPALVNLELAQANCMSNHDLVLHYVYVLEYCWNVLDAPTGEEDDAILQHTMTSILDLTGLDFSILRHRDLVGFVKQFVTMMSSHYPQRAYKTLIINAPSWFGMLYKLISPMLRESTKAKIEILSAGERQNQILKEVIGDECYSLIPKDVLEPPKKKRSHSELRQNNSFEDQVKAEMEKEFRQFCLSRLEDAGETMETMG